MGTREVGAGIFFARGFLTFAGWRVVAGFSWKRVGDEADEDEKSCRNRRIGEGPGCFGMVRVLILRTELMSLLDSLFE
jgi:hypothetical protein